MKRAELLKILKEQGVVFHRHGTRHDIYIHTDSGKKIPVPRHQEIKNKLVKEILDEIKNS